VVGHPSRRYLWILSRQTTLDAEILRGINMRLQQQGYDLQDMLMSPR
jgi:lipocalin